MTACERHEENISAFIDRELADDIAAELFAHLGSCPRCRRTFTTLATLHERIAMLPDPAVPHALDRRMRSMDAPPVARIARAGSDLRTLWRRRLAIPAPALAIALLAVMATILLSVLLLRPQPAPPAQQQVMYIMSMPAVEVEGVRDRPDQRMQ